MPDGTSCSDAGQSMHTYVHSITHDQPHALSNLKLISTFEIDDNDDGDEEEEEVEVEVEIGDSIPSMGKSSNSSSSSSAAAGFCCSFMVGPEGASVVVALAVVEAPSPAADMMWALVCV